MAGGPQAHPRAVATRLRPPGEGNGDVLVPKHRPHAGSIHPAVQRDNVALLEVGMVMVEADFCSMARYW